MEKISLVVHKHNGEYYSVRFLGDKCPIDLEEVVFKVEKNITQASNALDSIEEEAIKKLGN